MSQPAREYLSAQVSGDHLAEVFAILAELKPQLPEDLAQETILLSGRFERLQEQLADGILAPEEGNRERNRIRKSLLLLVSRLPEGLELTPASEKRERRRRWQWVLSLGLYLLLAGAALFWAFQPQPSLRVKGWLSMDRLSFTHQEGTYDFTSLDLAQARIIDFARLEIEADSLALDPALDSSWTAKQPVPSGTVKLQALPGIPGLGINLVSPLRLQELSLPAKSRLTLGQLTQGSSAFRLVVEHIDSISGSFSYRGRLELQPEQVRIGGLVSPPLEWFGPQGLRVSGPDERRSALRFVSVAGLFGLELFPQDSQAIQGKSLRVVDPSFFRKEGDIVRPTIRGGELKLQERNRPPMLTIPIQDQEIVALSSEAPVAIRQLRLSPAGIEIHFEAQVSRLRTGGYYDLRNPLRVEWLWHNQRWMLYGLFLFFFGMIFFLPGPIRERVMAFIRHMRGANS